MPMSDALTAARIRPATPADREAILRLFESHLEELGFRMDPRLDRDMTHYPEVYAGAGRTLLVAAADPDVPVGMGGLLDGEIRRLYVVPALRRQHLARTLVGKLVAIAWGTGANRVCARIARTNAPSRAVFIGCGFTPQHHESPPAAGAEGEWFELLNPNATGLAGRIGHQPSC